MNRSINPLKSLSPLLLLAMLGTAMAADAPTPFSSAVGGRQAAFPESDGRVVYERLCQGCHMSDGTGAKIAPANYPSLASNPKFAARAYPAVVVVNGLAAMPAFGTQLNDAQVAAVVNYLRTSFTNTFSDAMSPAEVQALRPVVQARPTELRGR